jgi:hypothetical protein
MTLQFGNLYIDQIFLVSEQLMTPMLIGCDFCIANGLILDFRRETLSMKQPNQSIEVNFKNRQDEARGGETNFAALRNRQAIALPTPLADPGQLTRSSKPHPVKPPPCDNEHCDPDPMDCIGEMATATFTSNACRIVRQLLKEIMLIQIS